MTGHSNSLPWLVPGAPFPAPEHAWGPQSEAPGLLAAGGDLAVVTLKRAYRQGIFPWFSEGQPILWWSPDPRMVLRLPSFRVHRSLRRTLQHFTNCDGCEVRFNTAFEQVIRACAGSQRKGHSGTWIVEPMVEAYNLLHAAGFAHSVETWKDGHLVGGLYCTAMGQAVFGESMFTRVPDASKIALAGLVAFCREHGVAMIDCQQNTAHLASLGAREIPRTDFLAHIDTAAAHRDLGWHFSPLYWKHVLSA
jgi:leucyl/phenylalanyl-tRNA--protein transferase